MKKIICILFALFIFNSSALADDWSLKEKNQVVEEFSRAFSVFEKKDVSGVLALTPPQFMTYFAKEQKQELSAYQEKVYHEINQNFLVVKSLTYRINDKNNKKDIEYLQTHEGEKYAIITYIAEAIYIEGDKDSITDKAIAIKIDGKWYFIMSNSHNIKALKTIYPQFNNIKNP